MRLAARGEIRFLLLLLVIGAGGADAADDWLEARSENFVVATNAGKSRARTTLRDLEEMRRLIATAVPGKQLASAKPALVVIFKDEKSMRSMQPTRNGEREEWDAMFRPTRFRDFILLRALRDRDSFRELAYSQYMHLLDSYHDVDYPLWLDNGMALFFANAKISERRAELGKMHPRHRDVLGEFRGLPIAELFGVTYGSPIYRGDRRPLFDAESWALVHYLLIGRAERGRAELQRFMQSVADGAETLPSFEQALGMQASAIDEEVAGYIRKQVSQYIRLELEPLDLDDDAEATTLPDSEVDALFGQLHLATGGTGAAKERLSAAVAATPESAQGNLGLGMLALSEGRTDEAVGFLRAARAHGGENPFASYSVAAAILETDASELTEEERAGARGLLEEMLAADPGHRDSARLYGYTSLFDADRVDDGVTVVNTALQSHRGDTNLLLILAQLLTRKGQLADSRTIYEALASRPLDEQTQAFVREELAFIEARLGGEQR